MAVFALVLLQVVFSRGPSTPESLTGFVGIRSDRHCFRGEPGKRAKHAKRTNCGLYQYVIGLHEWPSYAQICGDVLQTLVALTDGRSARAETQAAYCQDKNKEKKFTLQRKHSLGGYPVL